jgi:hypothetical protein
MDALTKAGTLKFVDYQISKGLVNGNTGIARKAACNKILEAFGPDDDLSAIDIRSEVLKFNNRHPGLLSPDSLNTYEKRVTSTLDEFKKYLGNPTGYKGVIGRPISNGGGKDKKRQPEASDQAASTAIVETPAPQPKHAPTSAVTDTSLMMPFPLRPNFLAQLIIPRDLSKEEAARLCAFIQALAHDIPVVSSSPP